MRFEGAPSFPYVLSQGLAKQGIQNTNLINCLAKAHSSLNLLLIYMTLIRFKRL
jgi:hypothetical protein